MFCTCVHVLECFYIPRETFMTRVDVLTTWGEKLTCHDNRCDWETVTSRQRTIQYLHVPLLAQTEHMAVPDEAKGEGGVTFHWFSEDVPGTMVRSPDELVNDTWQRSPPDNQLGISRKIKQWLSLMFLILRHYFRSCMIVIISYISSRGGLPGRYSGAEVLVSR